MRRLYDFMGGISEFYGAILVAALIVLAFKGLLTGAFAGAVSAVYVFVVAHDHADDARCDRRGSTQDEHGNQTDR